MFNSEALTVDTESLLLSSKITLSEASGIFTIFSLQETSKSENVPPETKKTREIAVNRRIIAAIENEEFAYEEVGYEPVIQDGVDGKQYHLQEGAVPLKEIIEWALSAGFQVPDDFSERLLSSGLKKKAKASDSPKSESSIHKQNIQEKISGSEKQELQRLKVERDKWNDSIEAAVKAGSYCARLAEGAVITRADFTDFLFQAGHKALPTTTIDKIWKALPSEIKSKGGRPKDSKNTKPN